MIWVYWFNNTTITKFESSVVQEAAFVKSKRIPDDIGDWGNNSFLSTYKD